MTVRQVADALGLKVRTIRKWIRMGYIPAYKQKDNSLYIPDSEIEKEEVKERAYKSREHSRRIKENASMGMLAGRSEDTKESL